MDTKVRDLFRMETEDMVQFMNFNEIYYIFEQLVQFDVKVPELEGLGERLSYALNMIATTKLDRNDIITFFPIVWEKFEVYVKQLLYIINSCKYEVICLGTLYHIQGSFSQAQFVKSRPECR